MERGAWGYVEGGMGGVSQAIACAAQSYGADIFTEKVDLCLLVHLLLLKSF